jgi:hypothetical protein
MIALDELTVREHATQDKLQDLGNEKRLLEQELEYTWMMLVERDYSSSAVISSAMVHVVVLLKSYTPSLDTELLRKEYRCKDDKERDGLIDSVFETT